MSSRQEEKQRRREERLEREAAEKAAAARRQRLTLAGAVLAGVAVIAVVVLLVSGAIGGGDDSESAAQDVPSSEELAQENIKLPEQQIGDINAAAKAAGCKLENPPIEGRNHETKDFTAADYKTNPPTSGNHFPQWYEDGIYGPGETPNLGMLVHTLEHGRIDVQYKPGTPDHTVKQLQALLAEQEDGYHMLLFENSTKMDAQIAATAWGHSLTCPQFNNKVFDALRTFRSQYIDQGPERVD
ncbi:MAG TPA: DUF3105 domain-containing protein [Solirubrobacteraceae bacterium]|nr:DUF3105 domain-containing protein [Solirubrobacteraceae bacterium]